MQKTKTLLILAIILIVLLGIIFTLNQKESFQTNVSKSKPGQQEKEDKIIVKSPKPEKEIISPLKIKGEARGSWFFEGSFPITLVDWDGEIIKEVVATAKGDWMTKNFVPFQATIKFESPYQKKNPDFMKKGSLIFQKANPSGLPKNDNALEIPIYFK